jgi:mono/diheme cytochrome c family protein
LETYLVSQVKLLKIPEAAPPATPVDTTEEGLAQGGEHFNHHCAVCHDLEGDADSDFAKSFYPPVADLISEPVQKYSNEQLKWIVDNGIRYTGMPGWDDLVDDVTQWKIVYYMRALADPEKSQRLEELLKERGRWKVQTPVGEDDHDAAPEPSEQNHHHGESHEQHSESAPSPEPEHSQ